MCMLLYVYEYRYTDKKMFYACIYCIRVIQGEGQAGEGGGGRPEV